MPPAPDHGVIEALRALDTRTREQHAASGTRLAAVEGQLAALAGRVSTLERESHEAAAVRRALEARGVDEVSVVRELRVLRDGSTRVDGARMAGVVVMSIVSGAAAFAGLLKVLGVL